MITQCWLVSVTMNFCTSTPCPEVSASRSNFNDIRGVSTSSPSRCLSGCATWLQPCWIHTGPNPSEAADVMTPVHPVASSMQAATDNLDALSHHEPYEWRRAKLGFAQRTQPPAGRLWRGQSQNMVCALCPTVLDPLHVDPNDFRPALLGAQPLSDPPPYSEVESTNEDGNQTEEEGGMHKLVAHADERQIKLDTDRSFVLYPGGTE